jgi:DNA-binding NarL/FixJ family response regulator
MMRRVHEDLGAHAPAHRRLSGPWLAVCEAESTRLSGDPDAALWRRAADLFRDLPIPYWAAYARYREAEALLAVRRGKADAREALMDAHATGRRLSAAPLLAAIEAVAQRGRLDLDGAEPGRGRLSGPAGLTARELEVVSLLADGMTNRQIGERLFITEKTASHHVSTILSKLGVSRRGEVGSAATRLGILAPPE